MHSEVSHAKLEALAYGTLALMLERQRLQSTYPSLHTAQIVTNMRTLRSGVIALQDALGRSGTESGDGDGENNVAALRERYERLLEMFGVDEVEKACLESISLPEVAPPSPTASTRPATPEPKPSLDPPMFEPYTDEPHGMDEGGILLQQRHIMQDQDERLDGLSSSINRQHHLSLQINDELEAQTGLLDALDTELDGTDTRMTSARKRLAHVARGAKENVSTVTIGMLILVLLILIVVFKT